MECCEYSKFQGWWEGWSPRLVYMCNTSVCLSHVQLTQEQETVGCSVPDSYWSVHVYMCTWQIVTPPVKGFLTEYVDYLLVCHC